MQYDEAVKLVNGAVQLTPACAKFRNSLGVVHQAAGGFRALPNIYQ